MIYKAVVFVAIDIGIAAAASHFLKLDFASFLAGLALWMATMNGLKVQAGSQDE